MKVKCLNTLIIIILIMFFTIGIKGVLIFVKLVKQVFTILVSEVNSIPIVLIRDNILILLLKSSITYFIIGLILLFFNIKHGRFAEYVGKESFY